MTKIQRLLDQIDLTKQRAPANTDILFGFNELRNDLVETAGVKQVSDVPSLKVIDPTQFNLYLKEHELSITRLINDPLLRERLISGDDTLDVNYLKAGMLAAKPVCRITICTSVGEEGFGTGFLIAPQILITNNHVLPESDHALNSYAEFDYEKGLDGLPLPSKVFRFNASRLFYTNKDLDFSVVWVDDLSTDGLTSLLRFGYLKLNPNLGKTKEGNFVSIIQHPEGKRKKVALRENRITNLSLSKFIRYVTDTKKGSSGAAVFNDQWEVVAVHHAGIPRYNDEGKILNLSGKIWDKSEGEEKIDWIENEGVRVSSIIYDLTTNASLEFPLLNAFFQPLTDLETITRSVGIKSIHPENNIYYPEEKDATDRKQYYSSLPDPIHASYEALHRLVADTHTTPHHYSPSKFLYPVVDLHPDGKLRSIYSEKTFSVQELMLADQKIDIERQLRFIELTKAHEVLGSEAFSEQIDALETALPYNCEHVVCQSWFDKHEPMRGDLHHLFACESRCNSFRNNHPYHDFANYKPQLALKETEKPSCGYLDDDRFEPERNRGTVARATLYFMLRYPSVTSVYGPQDLSMLKEWARTEPVSLYEKHRNREIFLLQGNRNPFIDFPELVESASEKDTAGTGLSLLLFPKLRKTFLEEGSDLSLEDLVKLAVLKSGGKKNSPSDLDKKTSLTTLIKTPEQLVLLQAYLSAVLEQQKPGKTITATEIENCNSVEDLIVLIAQK